MVSVVLYMVESTPEERIEKRMGIEAIVAVIMYFASDGIEEYGSFVVSLERNEYRSKPKKFEIDKKHRESPIVKTSIEEATKLEVKDLPPYLRYVFLDRDDTLMIKIVVDLNVQKVEYLVEVSKCSNDLLV